MIETLKRLVAVLFGAAFIEIQIHTRPDGDCVGSGMALASWLRDRGQEVIIYSPDEIPGRLAWVVGDIPVTHEPVKADLIVSLDSPAPFMWGGINPDEFGVVIDHHPHARVVEMATKAIIHHRPDAAAVAQILAEDIIPRQDWTPAIAAGLFMGIHQDTGGFQFSNTSAEVLGLAADLVRVGNLEVAEINRHLNSSSAEALAGLGATLATVREEDGVVFATAPVDSPAGPISRELAKVTTADISIVVYPASSGPSRVELRTPSGSVNVGSIARSLGGGGHDKAAGFQADQGLDTAEIVALVRKAWAADTSS